MSKNSTTNWMLVQSQRLAKRGAGRDAIIEAFLRHVPESRSLSGMAERLRREALAIRLPAKRPLGLAVAGATCRALLGTASLGLISYLVFLGPASEIWDREGHSAPLAEGQGLLILLLAGALLVAVQVLAEVARLRAERKADEDQAAAQIELFFDRASAFAGRSGARPEPSQAGRD